MQGRNGQSHGLCELPVRRARLSSGQLSPQGLDCMLSRVWCWWRTAVTSRPSDCFLKRLSKTPRTRGVAQKCWVDWHGAWEKGEDAKWNLHRVGLAGCSPGLAAWEEGVCPLAVAAACFVTSGTLVWTLATAPEQQKRSIPGLEALGPVRSPRFSLG